MLEAGVQAPECFDVGMRDARALHPQQTGIGRRLNMASRDETRGSWGSAFWLKGSQRSNVGEPNAQALVVFSVGVFPR